MSQERLNSSWETYKGEDLKKIAELTLSGLSKYVTGQRLIEAYAFGLKGRIIDDSLRTVVAGIEFENPVHFGAGWDKVGRAVRGLYHLGFGGGEVGTVLPFKQYGSKQPRLWTINSEHSVGLNRQGFNTPGEEDVGENLEALGILPCPIGINVGKNKILPNEYAAWSHAEVISYLYKFGSYFVLDVSSPSTKGLRDLQDKGPLRESIQASHEAMDGKGERRPLLIKIDAERTEAELDDMIEVVVEEGAAGFIATNTYMASDLKAKYGERWANEDGGLSGDDPDYRRLTTGVVRYLHENAGDKLYIIGVGAVKDTATALDKIKAGASAVQVVTAIRPTWGKVAANTNKGLVEYMQKEGIANIQDLIGADTKRGVKKKAA
jgi:dihydroorotate dehydrogenase